MLKRLVACSVGMILLTLWLLEFPIFAEQPKPAVAERAISSEDSLNPLVDLVRAQRESEATLRKMVQKRITISFQKVPLGEALKLLEDNTEVLFFVEKSSLKEEGVTLKDVVSCTAINSTLHQALDQMLEPLGLGYRIEDEVIKICNIIENEERLSTRHHDISDLLKWEETHRHDVRALSSTVFDTSRPHHWLLSLIEQETSGPWVNIDGTGGQIDVYGTTLSIRQTERVHAEIPGILKLVRLFIKGGFGKDKSVFLSSLSPLDGDLAARRALATRVSLNFHKTPLDEVVKHLVEKLKVPVVIDEQALQEEGEEINQPITFRANNITLESALKLMLRDTGLEAIVYRGKIVITSTIACEEILHTAVYDVRDLLQDGAIHEDFFGPMIMNNTSGPWVDIDGTGGTAHEPLPGMIVVRLNARPQKEVVALLDELREQVKERKAKGLPPRFPHKKPKPEEMVIEFYRFHQNAKPAELQAAIYEMVESKSWKKNGGEGAISVINHFLVIKNRVSVHYKIHKFLDRYTVKSEKWYWNNMQFGTGLGMGNPVEFNFPKPEDKNSQEPKPAP